jgi:3-hydroxyacyl-[acyl-carrier-protein] dehydratase
MNHFSAAMLAYLSQDKTYQDFICYLASIDNARFKKVVLPGDTLILKTHYIVSKKNFSKFEAQAFVDADLVCSCQLMSVRGR